MIPIISLHLLRVFSEERQSKAQNFILFINDSGMLESCFVGEGIAVGFIQAMDVFGKTGNTSVDFNEVSLDLSLFDSKKTDPYYHNSLNDIPTVHEQRHS